MIRTDEIGWSSESTQRHIYLKTKKSKRTVEPDTKGINIDVECLRYINRNVSFSCTIDVRDSSAGPIVDAERAYRRRVTRSANLRWWVSFCIICRIIWCRVSWILSHSVPNWARVTRKKVSCSWPDGADDISYSDLRLTTDPWGQVNDPRQPYGFFATNFWMQNPGAITRTPSYFSRRDTAKHISLTPKVQGQILTSVDLSSP